MLVRITNGRQGIEDYLEKGRKKGREFERDQLDHRLHLSGDMTVLRTTLNQIETLDPTTSKYLHITIGFSERYTDSPIPVKGEINAEMMQSVHDDYRKMLMNAYDDREYVWYSEAHVPKLSHEFTKHGEYVERLPHIHIVLPMRNLVDGRYLNPTGFGESHIRYFEAIQESINTKYGLKSPKEAVRFAASQPLTRHTGLSLDVPIKDAVAQAISARQIISIADLNAYLSQKGTVKTRKGREGNYLNVTLPDAAKGINFKEYSEQYFLKLSNLPLTQNIEKDNYKYTLKEWVDFKSYEARHITSGNRKVYLAESANGKQEILGRAISNSRQLVLLAETEPAIRALATMTDRIKLKFSKLSRQQIKKATGSRRLGDGLKRTSFAKRIRDIATFNNRPVDKLRSKTLRLAERSVAIETVKKTMAARQNAFIAKPRITPEELPTRLRLKLRALKQSTFALQQRGAKLVTNEMRRKLNDERERRLIGYLRTINRGKPGGRIAESFAQLGAANRRRVGDAVPSSVRDGTSQHRANGSNPRKPNDFDGSSGEAVGRNADPRKRLGRQNDRGFTAPASRGHGGDKTSRGSVANENFTGSLQPRLAALARAGEALRASAEAFASASARYRDKSTSFAGVEKGARDVHRGRVLGALATALHRVQNGAHTHSNPPTNIVQLDVAADRLKAETRPQTVLDYLVREHGVDGSKYVCSVAADGTSRLIVGGKQYNLGDVFTKHLGIPWEHAKPALLKCWQADHAQAMPQARSDFWKEFLHEQRKVAADVRGLREKVKVDWANERAKIRERYKLTKDANKPDAYAVGSKATGTNKSRKAELAQRQARAMALAKNRAERLTAEHLARTQARAKLEAIKIIPRLDAYRVFLETRVRRGDVAALNELRRVAEQPGAVEPKPQIQGRVGDSHAIPFPTFVVDKTGKIVYSIGGQKAIEDAAKGIRVLSATETAYDAAIRLAATRYGKSITLTGDAKFIAEIQAAAIRTGVKIDMHNSHTPLAGPLKLPIGSTARPRKLGI